MCVFPSHLLASTAFMADSIFSSLSLLRFVVVQMLRRSRQHKPTRTTRHDDTDLNHDTPWSANASSAQLLSLSFSLSLFLFSSKRAREKFALEIFRKNQYFHLENSGAKATFLIFLSSSLSQPIGEEREEKREREEEGAGEGEKEKERETERRGVPSSYVALLKNEKRERERERERENTRFFFLLLKEGKHEALRFRKNRTPCSEPTQP